VRGQQEAPAALYPRERPGTYFTEGWVGPSAGLDGLKISSPPGFDPGPSSPYSVAVPTELHTMIIIFEIHRRESQILSALNTQQEIINLE